MRELSIFVADNGNLMKSSKGWKFNFGTEMIDLDLKNLKKPFS